MGFLGIPLQVFWT